MEIGGGGEEKMATHTMVTGKKRRRRRAKSIEKEKLRPWSDLPQELLELIKKRLIFSGQRSFPAVCKSWSSIGIFPPAKQIPWLIVFDETDANKWSSCKLIDPTSKKTYTIDMKAIKEKKKIKDFNTMKVHESKYGWLLISSQYNQFTHNITSLFLYSPFHKEKNNFIELPDLYYSDIISLATFTSYPLKEDCKFLTLTPDSQSNGVIVSTYSRENATWFSLIYSCSTIPISLAEFECWTFSEEIFYCANFNNVWKLELNKKCWFTLLPPPPPITWYDGGKLRWYDGGKLHIVKTDGEEELFLIFERNLRTSYKMLSRFVTYIYRLDVSLWIWKRVDSFDDHRVLFIGDGYNCVLKMCGRQWKGISYRLYYCSGLELKFCRVDGVKHRRSYNCFGHYGSLATTNCRKLLIDPPSLPLHKMQIKSPW